jgi:hypothetical protein
MPVDYLDVARKALEYFGLIGGMCVFCKNCERVATSGEVYCKLHGRTHPVIKCKSFEPEAKLSISPVQGETKAEKREGAQ